MEILIIVLAVLAITRVDYSIKTGDTSLQGYFEHIKDKFWTKKEGKGIPTCKKEGGYYVNDYENDEPKQQGGYKPSAGSQADFERWKAEREKRNSEEESHD